MDGAVRDASWLYYLSFQICKRTACKSLTIGKSPPHIAYSANAGHPPKRGELLVTLLSISLRVMVLVVSVDGFVAAVRDHGGVAQVMEMAKVGWEILRNLMQWRM